MDYDVIRTNGEKFALVGDGVKNTSTNNVDTDNIINTVVNGCVVTICFSKSKNEQVVRNVLENLLDTFENRIKTQMENKM